MIHVKVRGLWVLERKYTGLVKFNYSLSGANGNERGQKFVDFGNRNKSGEGI